MKEQEWWWTEGRIKQESCQMWLHQDQLQVCLVLLQPLLPPPTLSAPASLLTIPRFLSQKLMASSGAPPVTGSSTTDARSTSPTSGTTRSSSWRWRRAVWVGRRGEQGEGDTRRGPVCSSPSTRSSRLPR